MLRHSASVLESSSFPQKPPVLLASKHDPSVQNVTLSSKQEKFYAKYDGTEGVTTAVVLGGFFVFVCLLVIYKTKLKPAWKDRQARRHDNTPATRSELSSHSHLHKENNYHVLDIQKPEIETGFWELLKILYCGKGSGC